MKKTVVGWVLVIAFLGQVATALAGTATGQFNVTSTVMSTCAVSAPDLTFGTYTASSGSALTANTTISVTCTSALPYTVALDGGTTTSSVAARAMTDGAAHNLNYNLYTTSSFGTVFGDGTAGSSTQAGTGTGAAQSVTVYGRVPAAQYVRNGSFTDRITITVAY